MAAMSPLHEQGGTSLIEVLVTVVIVALGLMGAAGLQSRMQLSEVEAYQRTQALVLLNDMANRITVNRSAAASVSTFAGASANTPTRFASPSHQKLPRKQE